MMNKKKDAKKHKNEDDAKIIDEGTTDETAQTEDHEQENLTAELEACRNQLYRMQADFDNYRKRMMKEQFRTYHNAVDSLALSLLPVLDDLERAIRAAREVAGEKNLLAGVEMIHRRLLEILNKEGIVPMVCVGDPFDPNCHQAVQRICVPEQPENTILEETQRGYRREDRVIRPAMVVVSTREEE